MRILVTKQDMVEATQERGHDPIAQCLSRRGFSNISVYQEGGYIIAIDDRPKGDGRTKCWKLPKSAVDWIGAWYANETIEPPPIIYAPKKKRQPGER